jgi:hypothetical protein
MADIMKKLTKLINAVDKVIEDGKKVVAAGMDLKESLPKKGPDDDSHDQQEA